MGSMSAIALAESDVSTDWDVIAVVPDMVDIAPGDCERCALFV